MIERVRGTRDILDTQLFNFAVKTAFDHLSLYNYQHIMTPIIEPVELFKRSLGTETDVVSKEMFLVHSSAQESSEQICLRPEATASTVRAFVQSGIQSVPWKVFSYGPMFRYERPQKGRYRQFYQFNIECIGSNATTDDVLLISLLDTLFSQKFKLKNYALHINFLGNKQERATFTNALKTFLTDAVDALCATCVKRKDTNPLRVLDCKDKGCQKLFKNAPQLADFFEKESQTEWKRIQQELNALSVSYTINTHLVRGLDYYNNIVFEFVSSDLGSQSAFCGGGRYNFLVSQISGKEDQPSIGAAIGLDRLLLLLEQQENLCLTQQPPLHVIIPFSQEQEPLCLHVSQQLIEEGLATELLCYGSLKKMMKRANKMGAHYTIIIGPEEQQAGTAVVKNMQLGKEETLQLTDLPKFLKQ